MKTLEYPEIKYAIIELNSKQFLSACGDELTTDLGSALFFETPEEAKQNIKDYREDSDPPVEEVVVEVELRLTRVCT